MSEFKRGITKPNFIAELNGNKYWQQMVNDQDLFIAIRNNYLNVYYYGQSICKVEFVNNEIKWTSHPKYLGQSGKKPMNTGDYLEKIEELKLNTEKYRSEEKEKVKENFLNDKRLCILDVEITFGTEVDAGRRSIDFLAIEKDSIGKIRLVFYEAKCYNNKEIRSRTNPRVFEQIEKYEKALRSHRHEILNSYRLVYENIKELNLNNKKNLVQFIGSESERLEIDDEPRLIIFVDESQIDNTHIQKLKARFGDSRTILKISAA